MDKVLVKLKDKIRHMVQGIRNGIIKEEDVDEEVYKIIDAAAELYKKEDIELMMPMNNENPLLFQENGIYFIPLYSCAEEIKECNADAYRHVSFRQICDYVYGLIENGDKRLAGVMLDPESDDLFAFESWVLGAVVSKGMGADSFKAIDSETLEVKHEL